MLNLRRSSAAALIALALLHLASVAAVTAAANTLRIDPPTSGAARGATVSVKVVQRADVAISGAQATIVFDPTKLQLTSIARGTPYESAALFLGADAVAIARANSSGKLPTVAAAFLPPGAVPAGDRDFLVLTFTAIDCGEARLDLPVGPADAGLLDGHATGYGTELAVATTGGTVSICGADPEHPTEPTADASGGAPFWPVAGLIALAVVAVGAVCLRLMSRRA